MTKQEIIEAIKQGNPQPWLNSDLKEDIDILKQVILNYDQLTDLGNPENIQNFLPKNPQFFKALRNSLFSSLDNKPELKLWKRRMHFSELLTRISPVMDAFYSDNNNKTLISPDRGLIDLNRHHRFKEARNVRR